MNSTERVMAAISFQKPDILPVWDSYWDNFTCNWRQYMGFNGDENPADYYRIDVSIHVADETFFPSQKGYVRDEGDYEISRDGWGRTIRTGKRNTFFMETLETVLNEPDDIDMALDEAFCDALFDKVAYHLTRMALETLKRTDAWETGLWVYDDMANTNSTMFSPAMFEGFNPLEPRCGLDLCKLRERYGKRMVFFGGVCNTRILPRGDRREIEEHVRPLIDLAKDGGVVLGSASIGEDISPETYDYYMSLVQRYGG